MSPSQIENWIEYSDCVVNDVTHKTNRYGMALSLFVGFDNNRHNVLLAQALLTDENADPAVDAAIWQILPSTYPIHCAYHITQNLHKNLRKTLDQCLQKFLTPTMLKMHRDEINQSLYYTANLVENADEEYPTTTSLGEILNVNLPQTTLIPTRWYCTKINSSDKLFLTADKFMQEEQNITYHHNSVPYLCLFDQKNRDFHEERLTIYEQRIVYGKLHGTYKKALLKALQTSSKSQKLINLLQEFIENEEIDEYSDLEDEFQQDDNTNDTSDKENNAL
ncbi:hypothetical protein RhiirA4_461809, partial [Rhizophagus irregularis]